MQYACCRQNKQQRNYLNPPKHSKYEGHLQSKERFAVKKHLLIIGKKKNMQVLSHTFTYFSTQSPWTLEALVP
jgi:hypothetical protein